MSVDREQVRRDAEILLEMLQVMEDRDMLALNREGQRGAIQILTALLAELEQAEREREEIGKYGKGRTFDELSEIAGGRLRRAEAAEARLAKVPALVEALKRIESGAMSNPGHEIRNVAKLALATWESE